MGAPVVTGASSTRSIPFPRSEVVCVLRLRRPCGLPAFRIEAGGRRGQKTFRERLRKLSVILQLHIDFSSSQKGKRRIPFLQIRAGVRLLIAVAALVVVALLF